MMDSTEVMMMGQMNRGKEEKVFDWDKAAKLIQDHGIKSASAGLIEDWLWTAGEILKDGEPVKNSYTYLASTWATPTLRDDDTDMEHDCYRMASEIKEGWGSDTKWPEEVVKKLEEKA